MGYVSKTISKDEAFIRRAKISKLSFLDRIIAAVLYIIDGIFCIVNIFLKLGTLDIGEQHVSISNLVSAGVGLVLIALALLLCIYLIVQKITRAAADARIPGRVFARLIMMGLAGVIVGVVVHVIGVDELWTAIINAIFGILFGGFILLFTILRYTAIKLVLTDKRVFGKKNIWRTEAFDIPISKADNVVVVFSFWGKMFNYATVTIKSVMGDYKIKYVKSAEEFKNLIIDFAAKVNR